MTHTTVILNLKPLKNTINRDRMEMIRICNLYKRGIVSKKEAMDLMQEYIKDTRGRYAARPYPYKLIAQGDYMGLLLKNALILLALIALLRYI